MSRNQPSVPKSALPGPNAIANPINANAITPAEKSIKFFIMMLATLLARVRPASTSAKPACMKITRTAAIKTQMLSRVTCTDSAVIPSCAIAGAASTSVETLAVAPTMSNLLFILFIGGLLCRCLVFRFLNDRIRCPEDDRMLWHGRK